MILRRRSAKRGPSSIRTPTALRAWVHFLYRGLSPLGWNQRDVSFSNDQRKETGWIADFWEAAQVCPILAMSERYLGTTVGS
jgi:hypothetical protein